jgi:outer membrane scaffolding protein for murein synthesis (MipA/OmpV family)
MKRNLLLLTLMAGCASRFLAAEDGWGVSLGAGLVRSPVYEGSGDYYISPVPDVNVGYTTGGLSFSASLLNGLGISCMHSESGFLANINVAQGPERDSEVYTPLIDEVEHSGDTQRLLEDTPTARSPVSTELTVGTATPVGLVGMTIGYRPTVVEKTYHAFVATVFYMIGLPLSDRLTLSAFTSLDGMDGRYAEAWYSLEEDTPSLDAFDAKGGLRAAQLAIEGSYMVRDRLGISLLARGLILLGDAAQSPYTETRFQTDAMLRAFYQF